MIKSRKLQIFRCQCRFFDDRSGIFKEKSSELNARDERNIAKDLDDIMEKLTNKEDGPLNYNGIDLDDDTISLLSDAIGLGLRQIKIRNKEKYTPRSIRNKVIPLDIKKSKSIKEQIPYQ